MTGILHVGSKGAYKSVFALKEAGLTHIFKAVGLVIVKILCFEPAHSANFR